jgi:mono/diheme cytochrome c family protein
MKGFVKIIGILFLLIVVSVGGWVTYVKLALPNIEAIELTVEITPEKVARGKYLATNVMVCMDCHSQRDFSKFSGPPIEASWGGGGEKFGHEIGMPGEVFSSNITPSKLSEYTDGELYRAITSGVAKDGRAMFNIMPYGAYGRADKKDIEAVIAYIRSIQPVENDVPVRSLDFPVNILINTVPVVAKHEVTPDKSNTVEYGRYMVMISGCVECHTPMSSPGKLDMDFAFSGGFEFAFPDGSIVRSMNITPHATGLGAWTKEMFINKFKGYNLETYAPTDVAAGEFNTVMPWTMYAGMSEEDLSAIYEYLRTVTPMNKTVERFTGPPEKQM